MGRGLRVAELWRYPVKSLRGERLDRARIELDGIAGDRLLRVEDERGLVTARTRPGLLRIAATVGPGGEPLLDGEDWRSPAARRAVSRVAPGCELASTAGAPPGLRFDLTPLLVLTSSMVAELGVDHRRLRPNVLIDGAAGREEADWAGARLRLGSAVLTVRSRCERCVVTTFDPDTIEQDPSVLATINADFDRFMGLNCDVAVAGVVRRGDQIEVERPRE